MERFHNWDLLQVMFLLMVHGPGKNSAESSMAVIGSVVLTGENVVKTYFVNEIRAMT